MVQQETLNWQRVCYGDFCHVQFDQLEQGRYPEHTHDYVEIALVIQGRALHVVDGAASAVSSGDVCVLQGTTRHGFQKASMDFQLCNVMYAPHAVHLPVGRLKMMAGYQALFVLGPVQRGERVFRSQLRLNDVQLREALRISQRLNSELKERPPGFDCLVQALLLELIVLLSRTYMSIGEPGDFLRLGEAVAYMETNYLQPMTVADLAEKAHLSKRHFLRMFGQTFGKPPIEYLIRLRVEHARGLLEQTAMSISQVAFASGFNDSNYFSRQFRRLTKCSPRAFRKSLVREA